MEQNKEGFRIAPQVGEGERGKIGISSNYDTELSLTGERGITKSATKGPQVRRLIMEEYRRNGQEGKTVFVGVDLYRFK